MSIEALKSVITAKGGIARPNKFHVQLPSIPGSNMTPQELNVLCRTANLPSKQVATIERRINMEVQKFAYGYVTDDVSLSFLLTNDYGVKKYFDTWRSLVIDEEAQSIGFKDDYSFDVFIHQLKESTSDERVFIRAQNDVGEVQNLGNPIFGRYESIYTVQLIEAYPISTAEIGLNNEQDGIIELNMQFAYTNWRAVNPSQRYWNLN